ncbi:hypothetical protein [Pseudonocardia xishanensis]|uniref:Uncharacterized protein n=1 Tax=Pseudonocardia xishanensis TaxID=630995 RepID=A0ABP8RW60_9PSEU
MSVIDDQDAHPLGVDPQAGAEPETARDAVNRMVDAGLLDGLMSKVDVSLAPSAGH